MREISGRSVLSSLDEVVRPSYTALLVVDMQNDYLCPGGVLEQQGRSISHNRDIVPRLKHLLFEARRAGLKIVYIQSTALPNHQSESPAFLRFWCIRWGMESNVGRVVEGTWGHEIYDELAPSPHDFVVKKWRPSAFIGTKLDLLLRANGIRSIVVTGTATEGCVLATATVGFYLDYYVTVVSDCIASTDADRHADALNIMSLLVDVEPADALIEAWMG